MNASCHELIRGFLTDWRDTEALHQFLLKLVFAENPQSSRLRRIAESHYGALSDPSNQSEMLSDFRMMLMERKDAFLQSDNITPSFLIVTLKNAIIDQFRSRAAKREAPLEQAATQDGDDGTEVSSSRQGVDGEARMLCLLAARHLTEMFKKDLSESDLRVLCDYLNRVHGERGPGSFLPDLSESARFKRTSRLKERLRVFHEQDGRYSPFRDREIWRTAFQLVQSEICPRLRSLRMSDTNGETS